MITTKCSVSSSLTEFGDASALGLTPLSSAGLEALEPIDNLS